MDAPSDAAGYNPLTRWQQIGLAALFVLVLGFGGLVEMRSAFLSRRMGDLDCFLRAGWAVRVGGDLYEVTDDNGFHYNYPPLLAILAAPLADPPADADRTGMLPFPVSVALWYFLNVSCLAVGVHVLARALEQTAARRGPIVPCGSQRWWALRLWPVLACLIPIGHTLMRGQSNLLVLACLCAALADLLRERRFRAGIWLAGAICLKIFPAFLLLYPLWRRDGRCLAGCAAGLVLGLVVIPAAALGPARTLESYTKLADNLILPAAGVGGNDSRAMELTNVNATESQSILTALHNHIYPNFFTRPSRASLGIRLASYLLGGLLTGLTLLATRRRDAGDGTAAILFFGLLALDMILLCPVCHLHYFCLLVPLVMGLVAARWDRWGAPKLGLGLASLFVFSTAVILLPHLPQCHLLREVGVAIYAALAFWLVGLRMLWAQPASPPMVPQRFWDRAAA